MSAFDFDLLTIGAGSGGVRASRMAARYGARVAVCEAGRVGGTCVLRGCVPKKLLVYGAHFADAFADAVGYGWTLGQPAFDWPTLIANKNRELDRLEGIYGRILRESGVEIVKGHARLLDRQTVEVAGRRITARHVLIATGGRPHLPDIPGIEYAISSDEALDLAALPRRVAIVGGGYIAVEFAGIFSGLGAEVTLIIRGASVLRGFDADLRSALTEEMERRGIKLMCDSVVRGIQRTGRGLSLHLAMGDEIEADAALFATGRVPNTENLGLAEAGVATGDNGAIEVDAYSRTSADTVYAVGDVTDRMNLTPVALAEGAAVARTLFDNAPTAVDHSLIPTAVFCTPPIGTVGLTEDQARLRHAAVDVYVERFGPLLHTLGGREEKTLIKLVVDADTDRVLGCHMIGMDAPEIVQGLAVALKCGATKSQFDATIGIHPTAAEEFVTLRDKLPSR
ncbi:MAG: glutathione-disulfide reductase [Rhodospirillaceae bacterium]|nr:glutathione-disulfide reductase [Rhodospirillaceae bacterium]